MEGPVRVSQRRKKKGSARMLVYEPKCIADRAFKYLENSSFSRGHRQKDVAARILMVFNTLLFWLYEFLCLFTLILAHYHVLVQLWLIT